MDELDPNILQQRERVSRFLAFVDDLEPRISSIGARLGRTVRHAQAASEWLFKRFKDKPETVANSDIENAYYSTANDFQEQAQ